MSAVSKPHPAYFLLALVLLLMIFIITKLIIKHLALKKRIALIQTINAEPSSHELEKPINKLRQYLESFVEYLRHNHESVFGEYKHLLKQSGWDSAEVFIYIFPIKIVSTLMCGAGAFFLIKWLQLEDLLIEIVILVVGFALGWKLFNFYLNRVIARRYQKINLSLSAFIDVLLICLRSGSSVNKAFELFIQEFGPIYPELAYELTITIREYDILPNYLDAYENLSIRLDIPIVKLLTKNLRLSEERGVSLIETITNVSIELQAFTYSEIERKMGKVPALLSASIVLFTLPIIFILILGPIIHEVRQTVSF